MTTNDRCRIIFLAVLFCLAPLSTSAEVVFNFTYFDVGPGPGTGVGFDDPTLGAARRASLESTAAQIGARIGQTATVEIGIAPSETDGSGFGGIASATFLDTSAGIRDGEIYRRIVLGEPDTSPGTLDGGMAFDFGYAWALSGDPPPGVAYFPDVVRHEITHALGFGSFVRADGTGFNGTTPDDMYTRFDSMITTSGGSPIIDSAGTHLLSPGAFGAAYAAGLLFDGPATRASNGGVPIGLFPSDPTHSVRTDDVMFPSPAVGFARNEWSPRDIGVLLDLGYEIIEVPEPSSIVLLGLLTGTMLVYRRRGISRLFA